MRLLTYLCSCFILMLSLTSASAAKPIRVGVVDYAQLQASMRTYWAKDLPLPLEMKNQEKELQQLKNEIDSHIARITDEQNTLSDSEVAAIKAGMKPIQHQYTDVQKRYRQALLAHRSNKAKMMQAKVKTVIAKVAKTHQLGLVLPAHHVLFAEKEVDLTKEVVSAMSAEQ